MGERILMFVLSILLTSCKGRQQYTAIDWTIEAELPGDKGPSMGVAGPITGLIDDRLFVAGGANFPNGLPWDGGKKVYHKEAFLYRISGDPLLLDSTFMLPHALAYPANVSYKGTVFSAGGEDVNGALREVTSYRVDRLEGFKVEVLPDLPIPLSNAAMVYMDEALYVVGGENDEVVSHRIYRLDLRDRDKGWVSWFELPYPVTHTVALGTIDGEIRIIGGRMRNAGDKSTMYDRVIAIGVKNRVLRELPKLPHALAAGTGVCMSNGDCILVGGDDAKTFHKVEQMVADIAMESDLMKKQRMIREKNRIQKEHPGFKKEVWRLKAVGGREWELISVLPHSSPVTTTASLWGQCIVIPSGEIKAGIRTANILMGRLQ